MLKPIGDQICKTCEWHATHDGKHICYHDINMPISDYCEVDEEDFCAEWERKYENRYLSHVVKRGRKTL